MANSIRVELNSDGVRQLLMSSEMMGVCQSLASQIAARAGDGYATSAFTGRNRVNVSVGPVTEEAARDNRKNNTLLKAVR